MPTPDTYWAAEPRNALGASLASKVEGFYQWARTSPLVRRMKLARSLKYGESNKQGATSWEVRRGGVKGELARVRSDHFGDLAERRVTLSMQQPPAWQPVANNSDYASEAQAATVSTVLDYYYRAERVERYLEQAAEDNQWSGEGFVFCGWDVNKGEVVAGDPETGEEVREGDLYFETPTTLDVIRDVYASSWKALTSQIVRIPANKWDLAARFPEMADDILSVTRDWANSVGYSADGAQLDTDEIYLFHFIHERTPAMPEGRYTTFVSGNAVLMDGPLPFRTSPLKRMVERELRGCPFGWTSMFRCLGPQEVVDALTTAVTSNQVNNATNKFVGIKGSGLNHKQLSQAFAYLEVNRPDQVPVPLNFADSSAQTIANRKDHIAEMGMFAGINEIQRGVVNPAIKSGAHAALYDAIGNRNNSPLQRGIYSLAEDVGTFILHTLTDYAGDSKRTARIIGEANRQLLVTYTGEDLAGFDRVSVEATSHSMKTVTGKQAVADTLLEKNALGQGELAGQRYIQLVKTGDFQQLTEDPQMDALRRKRAKELLAKGQPVTVLTTDRHWLDIPEYLTVLATPEARENAKVVQAVNQTVQAALSEWRMMDPDLIAVLGGQPPPSVAMMGAGPPGGPSSTAPPKPGQPSQTPAPAGGPASELPASMPNLPSLPGSDDEYQPESPQSPEGVPIQ